MYSNDTLPSLNIWNAEWYMYCDDIASTLNSTRLLNVVLILTCMYNRPGRWATAEIG